jgi:uncharacterized protein DUF2066
MLRRTSFAVAVAFILAASAAPIFAAPAQTAPAATPARPAAQFGNLFTVNAVKIDATAESAILARDAAMAQGRAQAFTKLFRRLTASSIWSRQPQFMDAQLQRLVLNVAINGERRSTTRYLAEVNFAFNPAAVRALLRQSGVAFTETRSRPTLVIPVVDTRYDPMGMWSAVWTDPTFRQGLVPMILPEGDADDMAVLSRSDIGQVDWAGLAPLVRRYNAGAVVVAIASQDGKTVQAIQISATGRTASSFAFANPNLMGIAEAITDRVADTWKTRSSVDYGTRNRLVADVQFESLEQWAKIRAQLGAIRAISDMDVVGLARNEAEIDLSYFGRIEQLRDAMAQQNLDLSGDPGGYTLQLGGSTAVNAR